MSASAILALLAALPCRAQDQPAPAAGAVKGAASAQDEATTSGEDLGARPEGTPLSRAIKPIKQRMQDAASTLSSRDLSGRASGAQQQAVAELDMLIGNLQIQCEKLGGQCNKPTSTPTATKPTATPGAAPGQTAVTSTATTGAGVDRSAIGQLVKDLWGRLPDRQRDELLQPLSEEFLPEYAADIEEYFRVLAETPKTKPAEESP